MTVMKNINVAGLIPLANDDSLLNGVFTRYHPAAIFVG